MNTHRLAHLLTAAVPLVLVLPACAGDTLIPAGSAWKYLDDGSDQSTPWRDPAFDDSGWSEGPAQLGYGDGDEQTVVSYGGNSGNKHITTYFRHTFTVEDPSRYLGLRLGVVRDDGVVVYINGTEVARSNMPGGDIGYLTRASGAVGGADESAFQPFELEPDLLQAGENVIAAEIHQANPTSSDISFDLRLLGDDGTPWLIRGPYLQQTTPQSTVIRWRTDREADSVLRYGPAPDQLDQSVSLAEPVTDHEVRLPRLSPETVYYYAVESGGQRLAGGDEDHRFQTAPLPGVDRPTRVWVLGDSGTADNNARAVRDAYYAHAADHPADLWVMLGDNAYNDGTDAEYQAAVFDMYPATLRTTALWPTLGNHDGHSSNSSDESGPYYDAFTLPRGGEAGGLASGTEAYYSFDHANIHFICLDSFESDRRPGSPMLTWLQADLDATEQDWLVAFWHHPPYTKGSHNSDREIELREMRENALPILEAAGVDLVLSGHSHSYERSFLLDGHYGASDTLDPETMIVDGGDGHADGSYAKTDLGRRGTVYAVAGSSGKTSAGPLNHPVMFISMRELGSMVLDFDGDRLDAAFLRETGAIEDRFTIIKSACTVNYNDDRQLDTRDAIAFLHSWAAGDAGADFNGDGVVDISDAEAYLDAWSRGC